MFYFHILIAILVSAGLCAAYHQAYEEQPSKFRKTLYEIWGLIATACVVLLVIYAIKHAMILFVALWR